MGLGRGKPEKTKEETGDPSAELTDRTGESSLCHVPTACPALSRDSVCGVTAAVQHCPISYSRDTRRVVFLYYHCLSSNKATFTMQSGRARIQDMWHIQCIYVYTSDKYIYLFQTAVVETGKYSQLKVTTKKARPPAPSVPLQSHVSFLPARTPRR